MTKDQALYILKAIDDMYAKFQLNETKIEFMMPGLLKMDFEKVKDNLKRHVAENPFPPSISEIAAYEKPKNENLEKWREWEKEAAKVPEETKEHFRQKLGELQEKLRARNE